jgi:hypothetical protein
LFHVTLHHYNCSIKEFMNEKHGDGNNITL